LQLILVTGVLLSWFTSEHTINFLFPDSRVDGKTGT
jgi:hypothetical protein